jgi:hypothetical protein
MNIVFDLFLNKPDLVSEIQKSPDLNECFGEMYSFVQNRLGPLEEEITREERDEPGKLKGTIIFLESTPDDPGRFLGFHGYSRELTDKMMGSFMENDILFLTEKIKQLLNKNKN